MELLSWQLLFTYTSRMSLEKGYRIRTEHVPGTNESRVLGKGDFGTIQRVDIVTELLRKNETGEWQVERAKLSTDSFVTKTFHRESALENAQHSVDCYDELKAAGVKHIPGTHRLSDSDPRVVISTYLGKDELLITTNSVPEREKRPVEIDDASFLAMLSGMTEDLKKLSAHHLRIHHDDAIFFELQMNGTRANSVDFTFGDFDNIVSDTELTVEELFQKNVIQATRSFFWLMMSQQVLPDADPENDNWARVASRIQLWADSHGVDAQQVYDEYVQELEERIAKDTAGQSKGE